MTVRLLLFAFLLALAAVPLAAQPGTGQNIGKWDNQIYIKDINGRPVTAQYADVTGFPYVLNSFKFGAIELKNGRKFVSVPLRLNIVSHEINFISPNKEEGFIGSDFVKEVAFADSSLDIVQVYVFRAGLPAIDNHKANEFCQVLADGKIALIKAMVKRIDTRKNDLSGEIYKEFALYEDLFSYQNGEMKRFKKDKEFILNLMQDKRALMEAYFKANKGNLKNQQYLAGIFQYYNSL